MRNFLISGAHALAISLEVTISVVGIMMLLSFPASASHHFDQHFRANEVRRSIVRHSLLDGPEADGAQTVAPIEAQPAMPAPVIVESDAKPLAGFEFSAQRSLVRLLQRFKLGPSSSGGPDPVL